MHGCAVSVLSIIVDSDGLLDRQRRREGGDRPLQRYCCNVLLGPRLTGPDGSARFPLAMPSTLHPCSVRPS
jgi:hypothetical protein